MAGSDGSAAAGATWSEPELRIRRVFEAPRELVFQAWTDVERLARWWSPKGFPWISARLDLRPGSVFHYCMRAPNGLEMWGKFDLSRDCQAGAAGVRPFVCRRKRPCDPGAIQRRLAAGILNTLTLAGHGGKTRITQLGRPINATEKERQTFRYAFRSVEQGFCQNIRPARPST